MKGSMLAATATPSRRAAALIVVGWGTFALHLVFVTTGLGRGVIPDFVFVDVIHNATYFFAVAICLSGVARTDARRGATTLAAGMALWAAANVLWTVWMRPQENPPWPSIADACWLAFYPAAGYAVVRLVRSTAEAVRRTLVLDALTTALTVAAFATAFVMEPVLEARPASALGAAVTVAYPIGDIVLLSLVAGALTLVAAPRSSALALLAGGLTLFAVGDAIYAHLLAEGGYESGTILDTTWAAGMLLMGHAARRPAVPVERASSSRWSTMVTPIVAALGAVALLIYGTELDISRAAVGLAAMALLAAAVRMALAAGQIRLLGRTEREARTDALTGLPNRRAFYEHLNTAIGDAEPGDRFAVLILDMDGFKEINDTLGHYAGDALLCEAGLRLQRWLRRGDVVYRLGGDEYAALLHAVSNAEEAMRVASRLEQAMAAPFEVAGIDLVMHMSAGVALFPEHGADAESLFRHADVAMYQAKDSGTHLEIYSQTRDPHTPERLRLLGDLQRALHTDELLLHYQPKVTADGTLAGLEALVRWHHPDGSWISPGEFIPLAERSGLIAPLTDVVLEQALDQVAAWQRQGFAPQVAVNVATTSLLDAALPERLAQLLAERRLAPAALRLEFTETAVMTDPDRARGVLEQLRALGVGMSLDDFGTGHSSLAQLKHFVVDELKIDRSFVQGMHGDPGDAAIVQAAIGLAGRLGLTATAEGVETQLCWDSLVAAGCPVMQGYWIARPMPAADVAHWHARWQARGLTAAALDSAA